MKKFFKIVTYILSFILPILGLAAIGFRSTIGVATKPAHWAVVPEADGAARQVPRCHCDTCHS